MGYSLELINPDPGTNASDLATWAITNGIVDLTLDPDNDGHSHLAEFLFKTDPFTADAPQISSRILDGKLQVQLTIRNGADGLLSGGEESTDLNTWSSAIYAGRTNNEDGKTSNLFFEGTDEIAPDRLFLRAVITEQP